MPTSQFKMSYLAPVAGTTGSIGAPVQTPLVLQSGSYGPFETTNNSISYTGATKNNFCWISSSTPTTNVNMVISGTVGSGSACDLGIGFVRPGYASGTQQAGPQQAWMYSDNGQDLEVWVGTTPTRIINLTAANWVTSGSQMAVSYDGTAYRFYYTGSMIASYSSSYDNATQPAFQINYRGTARRNWSNIWYGQLTGSGIVVPATPAIDVPAGLKAQSNAAGGSPIVAPVSYSMTPWQSQSGFAFTTTPSSLVCTNYGSSANNVWAHVWSNTTPLQTNFRLAVQRHPVEWATVFGFFSGSIPNEFSISSINTKNSVLWYMDTGTSGHNSIVSSSANNTQSTGYTFTEAFTSQSVFEIQYNGTNYQFYINGVLKYTMVPMDNVNQQMIHPFFTTFRQVGPAGASSGFANISYGELTGSAATPSLPPTYITIR